MVPVIFAGVVGCRAGVEEKPGQAAHDILRQELSQPGWSVGAGVHSRAKNVQRDVGVCFDQPQQVAARKPRSHPHHPGLAGRRETAAAEDGCAGEDIAWQRHMQELLTPICTQAEDAHSA